MSEPMKTKISKHAAVVVIDVQRGLFETRPPPFDGGKVIQRINRVLTAARAAAVPVILVQHDGGMAEHSVRPFSKGWQLHPELEIRPGDIRVRKTACDAFYRTRLEQELRSRRVRTLVIMGYATEFCVDATLQNAVSRDLAVVVVGDAHTTNDSAVLKAGAIRRHYNWAWANTIARRGIRVLGARAVRFARRAK